MIRTHVAVALTGAALLLVISGCSAPNPRDQICEDFAAATNARVIGEMQYKGDVEQYGQNSDDAGQSAVALLAEYRAEYDAAQTGVEQLISDPDETTLVGLLNTVVSFGEEVDGHDAYVRRDLAAQAVIDQCSTEGVDVVYFDLD